MSACGWYGRIQSLLAPGAAAALGSRLAHWIASLPASARVLDVGCGPASRMALASLRPVGVDLAIERADSVRRSGDASAAACATELPFRQGAFDAAGSFGLLHHLPDGDARRAVDEMIRVTRPGGLVVVFDSVRPEPAWKSPAAWAIRALDRGRFVRRQADLESLLPSRAAWSCDRFEYARTGLEGLWCTLAKAS